MKLRNIPNLFKPTIATIGTFDGVHEGHKSLINYLVKSAKKFDQIPIVIIFEDKPKNFFLTKKIKSLCSLYEREQLIKSLGVENIISLKFDKEIQELSSKKFIDKLKINFGVNTFLLGSDSKIGSDQAGYNELKSNHPDISFIKFMPKKNKGKVISSTLVRKAIKEGDCEKTKDLLGRFYTIEGKVIKGKNLGAKLGFPTANILPSVSKVIPNDGIYASIVEYNKKKYLGATSIGKRPTFEKNGERIIETFIIDFNENIYSKEIKIHLIKKIRDEKKFNSERELIDRMDKDIKKIKLALNSKKLL
ncbi:MAG: riboflavin biosynthesis protein RibF [Chloroflexi bacterium]|nr:riboflavin biosynthesis protein RibF [Chloroflexota bacterium]